MPPSDELLFLGLLYRGGNAYIGEAVFDRKRPYSRIYLASDAGSDIEKRGTNLASILNLTPERSYSKAELGRALGRNYAALVAVTGEKAAATLIEKGRKERE